MVLTARLFISGHPTEKEGIPLNTCEFSFAQGVDKRGMPDSDVKSGTINFSFASFDDQEIIMWMMVPNQDKNGKIEFAGVESSKAFKTIAFEDARCVSYRETFSRDNEMITEMAISARYIGVSGFTMINDWSGYD